jgi:hypothetical protein
MVRWQNALSTAWWPVFGSTDVGWGGEEERGIEGGGTKHCRIRQPKSSILSRILSSTAVAIASLFEKTSSRFIFGLRVDGRMQSGDSTIHDELLVQKDYEATEIFR